VTAADADALVKEIRPRLAQTLGASCFLDGKGPTDKYQIPITGAQDIGTIKTSELSWQSNALKVVL
jgi:hypothetical protein